MQRRELLRLLAASPVLAAVTALPGASLAGGRDVLHRVRDLRYDRWLNSDELLAILSNAGSVAVGERHDNPEHHRLERWLIAQLAAHGELGGVAMEMLDDKQQAIIESETPAQLMALSDDKLQERLEWNPGWAWSAYGPTLRQVLTLGVPLRAANLNRQRIGEIVEANRAPSLPPAIAMAQRQALIDGHCGLLPESMLDGMLAAQVARDKAMASALDMLPSTSLLICGSGHARRDIGAAYHADEKPLCLGLVELESEREWRSVLVESVDDGPPFDLVWFTLPIAKREDPCIALRERFVSD